MESPLNVSGNLKLPVELPVLSPEMLYENEKYTANLVDLKRLFSTFTNELTNSSIESSLEYS